MPESARHASDDLLCPRDRFPHRSNRSQSAGLVQEFQPAVGDIDQVPLPCLPLRCGLFARDQGLIFSLTTRRRGVRLTAIPMACSLSWRSCDCFAMGRLADASSVATPGQAGVNAPSGCKRQTPGGGRTQPRHVYQRRWRHQSGERHEVCHRGATSRNRSSATGTGWSVPISRVLKVQSD